MSGFAIELRRNGEDASPTDAQAMVSGMTVLGSDRQTSDTSGPFAFARVHSAGYSSGNRFDRQPVARGDRWRLLFLGKLKFRDELAEKIGIDANALDRTPDCELAMEAWLKWGEDCRDHLYGGFSFVAVDLVSNRLTAVRSYDRSQHIFYYLDNDRIILSTSTRAIFAFPDIAREIDETKIADLLVLNHQDTGRSFFKNVSILGQAYTLSVEGNSQPKITYHDSLANIEPIRFSNDDDYVERANELLDRAVWACIEEPGKAAISLSGGLDSTAVTIALIERLRREGLAEPGCLKAYHVVPDSKWDKAGREDWSSDESDAVRDFAALYPELDVTFVSTDNLPFDASLDLIQSYGEMPIRAVGNLPWSVALNQQCRKDGITTLLNGVAGNGTISFAAARLLFARWMGNGNWIRLAREARMFVKKHPDIGFRSVFGQAAITNLPNRAYDAYMKLRGHDHAGGFETFSPIHPDFARQQNVRQRMEEFGFDDRYRRRKDRRKAFRAMMQQGARNDSGGLIEAARVMSGIQGGVPLEDRDLMQFCFAIPDDQFYRSGVDRWLVKRMVKNKLPQSVLASKRGDQGGDWHARRLRDLDRISEELDRLADVPGVTGRIDIARLKKINDEFPVQTPSGPQAYPEYSVARYGLGRALAVARFINQVEGRN